MNWLIKMKIEKNIPIPPQFSVEVDTVVNTDWSYNSLDNSIEFDISVAPDDGALIEISYAIYGCTE